MINLFTSECHQETAMAISTPHVGRKCRPGARRAAPEYADALLGSGVSRKSGVPPS